MEVKSIYTVIKNSYFHFNIRPNEKTTWNEQLQTETETETLNVDLLLNAGERIRNFRRLPTKLELALPIEGI